MTYCLGIITDAGLIMAADSRTNAGVDYVSTHQKLFNFSRLGDRVIIVCTAGNLSITQAVLNLLHRDVDTQAEVNLHTLDSLYEIARYIGGKVRQIRDQDRQWLEKDRIDCQCSFCWADRSKRSTRTISESIARAIAFRLLKTRHFCKLGKRSTANPFSIASSALKPL